MFMNKRQNLFCIDLFILSLTQGLLSYTQNGLLNMLDRNRRIKQHPERFQLCNEQFTVVITCEERVYDQVLECMYFSLQFNCFDNNNSNVYAFRF